MGHEALARSPNGQCAVEIFNRLNGKRRRIVELDCLYATGYHVLPGLLFVNLSPSVFTHQAGALARQALSHVPPSQVVVELTEHHPIPPEIDFAISAWREQGYSLAVDDVGGSLTSLMLVSVVRPQFIKLDRSVISSLPRDPGRADAFLRIANKLGAEVIAEGIEREEELTQVQKLGIKYGQGYLLGMPEIPLELATEGSAE